MTIDPIAKLLGEWSAHISIGAIFLRLTLSVLLSAIIGCERSSKRHSAGLRTFIVVSLASTMAVMIDVFLIESFEFKVALLSVASIIAVAILSSNSVLFTSKSKIKGLTTSVGLWGCGILGLTIGAGFYSISLIGFIVFIICLAVFPKFEKFLKNRSNHFEIHLELENKNNLKDFVATIRKLGLRVDEIEANPAYLNSGLSVYSIALTVISKELKKYKTHSEIIEAIRTLEYVSHIEEEYN